MSTIGDSYRPRDAFLDNREEVAKADQPGMEIDIPAFDLGIDDARHELAYTDVFPKVVSGPTLLGDTPDPVEFEPQRRGSGAGDGEGAGDAATDWSTGVGSVMLGPIGPLDLGTTGDWLGKGTAEAAPAAAAPSVIAALSTMAPRIDTLPSLARKKAGDPEMPYTGDWLGIAHEDAREGPPYAQPGSDLTDAELYPHKDAAQGLEKAARPPRRLAHSLTGV